MAAWWKEIVEEQLDAVIEKFNEETNHDYDPIRKEELLEITVTVLKKLEGGHELNIMMRVFGALLTEYSKFVMAILEDPEKVKKLTEDSKFVREVKQGLEDLPVIDD